MSPDNVAIVGCGLVGRAWAIAFARGGCDVRLLDPVAEAAAAALSRSRGVLADLEASDLLGDATPRGPRTDACRASLAEALDGAD